MGRMWVCGLLVLMLAACGANRYDPADLPTLIPSMEQMGTSVALTEVAPPPGYRGEVSYQRVDETLRELEGWRYDVTLAFDGVFAQTGDPTSARAEATVFFNQISGARRVLVASSGELLARPEGESFEAVRLGADAFLVRRGVCLGNAEDDAMTAAGISAGDLVGGVRRAVPAGQRERINGIEAYRYSFTFEDMLLPTVRLVEDTQITRTDGELWVSPEYDAVVRYWVTMEVVQARLLSNNLPVNGRLRLRYDLRDVGMIPNISVPFGC